MVAPPKPSRTIFSSCLAVSLLHTLCLFFLFAKRHFVSQREICGCVLAATASQLSSFDERGGGDLPPSSYSFIVSIGEEQNARTRVHLILKRGPRGRASVFPLSLCLSLPSFSLTRERALVCIVRARPSSFPPPKTQRETRARLFLHRVVPFFFFFFFKLALCVRHHSEIFHPSHSLFFVFYTSLCPPLHTV